jgi:hypothetical protein
LIDEDDSDWFETPNNTTDILSPSAIPKRETDWPNSTSGADSLGSILVGDMLVDHPKAEALKPYGADDFTDRKSIPMKVLNSLLYETGKYLALHCPLR